MVAQELLGRFGGLPAVRLVPIGAEQRPSKTKKADVAERLWVLPPRRLFLFSDGRCSAPMGKSLTARRPPSNSCATVANQTMPALTSIGVKGFP